MNIRIYLNGIRFSLISMEYGRVTAACLLSTRYDVPPLEVSRLPLGNLRVHQSLEVAMATGDWLIEQTSNERL